MQTANAMDEADLAQESIDFHLRLKLAGAVARPTGPVMENRYCEGCGEEIPEGRRKKMPGCTRCVECQTEAEA